MKKIKMQTKVRKYRKSNPKRFSLILIGLILLGGIFTYFLLDYFGLFGISPSTGYATVKVLDIADGNKDVSDEAKVTVYDCNIADMDTQKLSRLDFDDYKTLVDETTADKVNFYIDESHAYKMKVTYKDSVRWYNPSPGENVIMMVEKADSINMVMRDKENYNSTYLGNAELDYLLDFICDDDKKGLMPGYLYNDKDTNLIWICFNLTRTAQEDYAKVDDYHNEKVVSGTALYLGISGMVVDKALYSVSFSAGKASTYDVNNIGWYFGLQDEINPTWMA